MTTRKRDLNLAPRTPAYVSRETGAAELEVSPETWDRWVANGTLPPAAPGFPGSTPRWRWADVDRKLAGSQEPISSADDFVKAAGRLRGGKAEELQRGAA